MLRDPIETSRLEVVQEQKNEVMQQADIDKEMVAVKKDQDAVEKLELVNEGEARRKLQELTASEPRDTKARKKVQEVDDEKNKENFRSKLQLK
ncbi:MAG: hypothetical protein IH795_10820 [Bacteroidetes bacterium]|nr:hypothetical protein [Bacteroidota bacterium]